MAKMIKFDLPIDEVKVATLEKLRDHFTTEIIGHFRSGLLARSSKYSDNGGGNGEAIQPMPRGCSFPCPIPWAAESPRSATMKSLGAMGGCESDSLAPEPRGSGRVPEAGAIQRRGVF